MRCANCPLFTRYESEDDCYEVCGLFGDGWDNRFQYEDKEGTTVGCYIEKCYITKMKKEIEECYKWQAITRFALPRRENNYDNQ